jgi:hypothetical protein
MSVVRAGMSAYSPNWREGFGLARHAGSIASASPLQLGDGVSSASRMRARALAFFAVPVSYLAWRRLDDGVEVGVQSHNALLD